MRTLVVLALLAAGCGSAPQRIADTAVEIRQVAESSRERFQHLGSPAGVKEQDRIIVLTDEVVADVPNIQAIPSRWNDTLELVAWALAAIAVAFIVWHLGLGQLTRSLFSWVPRNKRAVAKLLQEADDPHKDTELREAIAALRAMDPQIDAAFRRSHAHGGDRIVPR